MKAHNSGFPQMAKKYPILVLKYCTFKDYFRKQTATDSQAGKTLICDAPTLITLTVFYLL